MQMRLPGFAFTIDRHLFGRCRVNEVPSGTPDNSPAIYRWVNGFKIPKAPEGRKNPECDANHFFRP